MIFTIICEELGLFGALCVLLAFGVLLWRIAHVSKNAPDLL
jgi:cell division protein FtsW